MAKFTDYTEKTEPVDTDLALIYDTPAKVNKKFTFGNLWKWIAKKIVSEGISQLETTNKTIPGAINELNSKTRIKLIDVNMTINDKTATIKYNISDTAIGLLLISGNIGNGVFFSIVINYGTKYSIKLLSFNSSNTDTSSIVINSDLGKITFNGNSKLESSYEVNGLLLG
jgi:hypothetical protein